MRPSRRWLVTAVLLYILQPTDMRHPGDITLNQKTKEIVNQNLMNRHHHRHKHKKHIETHLVEHLNDNEFASLYPTVSFADGNLNNYNVTTLGDKEKNNEWVNMSNDQVSDYKKHQHWPIKREAVIEGDLVLGGLMMVHERSDNMTCGPVMPQGGVQALETMLYTLDIINNKLKLIPEVKLGAHILDDCDKDTYGLEMAVDFIKGSIWLTRLYLERQFIDFLTYSIENTSKTTDELYLIIFLIHNFQPSNLNKNM